MCRRRAYVSVDNMLPCIKGRHITTSCLRVLPGPSQSSGDVASDLNLTLTLTLNPIVKPNPIPNPNLQDAISPTAPQQRAIVDGYVAMTERVHGIFAARRRQLQSLFVSQLPDRRLLWSRAAGTQTLSHSLSCEVSDSPGLFHAGSQGQVRATLHLGPSPWPRL